MKRSYARVTGLLGVILMLALSLPLAAQDLASFEKRVTVKTLPNGLTVLILRRPEAPVFSFFTMVDTSFSRSASLVRETLPARGGDAIFPLVFTASRIPPLQS